jgi:hypothetical protein
VDLEEGDPLEVSVETLKHSHKVLEAEAFEADGGGVQEEEVTIPKKTQPQGMIKVQRERPQGVAVKL